MAILQQNKISRSYRLLEFMLEQNNNYHNHKENMAHAGLAVQLAIASALLATPEWPPPWLGSIRTEHICLSARLLSVVGFLVIWLLVNAFIRWQLRNRRWAATFCAALEETLRRWARSDPTDPDLLPFTGPPDGIDSKLANLVDKYFLPWRGATLHSDVSRNGWPRALGVEWVAKAKELRDGPLGGEFLVSLGSVFALVLGLVRVLSA